MFVGQLELFHVANAYKESGGAVANEQLYLDVCRVAKVPISALDSKQEVGQAKEKHNLLKRKIRWYQQTLKAMGVIESTGKRGVWAYAGETKKGLTPANFGVKLVGYSTELGAAIWGDNLDFYSSINEPITLCVTSPPYPLRVKRNYGNVDEKAWVDFIVRTLEPIVNNLVPGGSIVLNVSNDIFKKGVPSRSLYLERMVLALNDELGLSLMDRIPWVNLSKPPSPTYWACVNRQQLCSGYEPIYWFTNDPSQVKSNNNRVLEPHSKSHLEFLKEGNTRVASYGDGAYKLRETSFSNLTDGKIPKNVIHRGHVCSDSKEVRKIAKELGLPAHSAMFPTAIPDFFIDFLTEKGDLVVDPFAGTNKTGLAAERKGRRWLCVEKMLEYIKIQSSLFVSATGFWSNPALDNAFSDGVSYE